MSKIDEKIDDAAREYAESEIGLDYIGESAVENAFKAGANFALSHQWVSVEDVLPEIDWKILTCRDIYLCRDSYWVALCIWDNGRFIETSDGKVFMATHWIPIPPLPEARKEGEE